MTKEIQVFCAYDELVSIEKAKPNPQNPNTHPESQVKLLAEIIKKQGWRAPITISNRSGYIVRGHGRLYAAQLLGAATVPVDFQDYASEADEKADMLADNRLAELSEIDQELLDSLLEELQGLEDFDMLLTGYESLEEELEEFTATDDDIDSFFAEPTDEEKEEKKDTMVCPHCGNEI